MSGYSLCMGQWLSTIDHIYQGADQIARAYVAAAKKPFAILDFSNFQVLVSSEVHIKELAQTPDAMLSFYPAMNQRLFSKHTMAGFEPYNGVDTNSSIQNRVFKILARGNLHQLSGSLQQGVDVVFDRFFEAGATKD